MSRRVSYKLHGDDAKAALDFANAVGHPLDMIAKIALFRYINDVVQRAAALEEKQKQQQDQ